MSGGVAYVYDFDGSFESKLNSQLVLTEKPTGEYAEELKTMIDKHYKYTKSKRAGFILENWDTEFNKFVMVIPIAYKEVITEINKCRAKGLSMEEAYMEAFSAVSKTKPHTMKGVL